MTNTNEQASNPNVLERLTNAEHVHAATHSRPGSQVPLWNTDRFSAEENELMQKGLDDLLSTPEHHGFEAKTMQGIVWLVKTRQYGQAMLGGHRPRTPDEWREWWLQGLDRHNVVPRVPESYTIVSRRPDSFGSITPDIDDR